MSASANLKFIFYKKLELRHAIPLNFGLICYKLIIDITLLHGTVTFKTKKDSKNKKESKNYLLMDRLRENKYDVFHRENMPQ